MSRWFSLSDAVLSMAVKHLPFPIVAHAYRIPRLVPERKIIGGNDFASSVLAEAEPQSIYLMVGQGLTPVNEVKSKNVVVIRGLGPYISKGATLRVVIRPSDHLDMSALMKGLRLLNRADPFVEITVSARGEHVLDAAVEIHLERCIKDLKDRFTKVNIEVSSPLMSYMEMVEGDRSNLLESLRTLSLNTSDYVEKRTPNGRCVIRVHVMKLQHLLTKLLDETTDLLGDIIGGKGRHSIKILESENPSLEENVGPIEALKNQLTEAVVSSSSETENDREKCKVEWVKLLKRIWALGPREEGPNILFAPYGKRTHEDISILVRGFPHVSLRLGLTEDSSEKPSEPYEIALHSEALSNIVSSFQLDTAS